MKSKYQKSKVFFLIILCVSLLTFNSITTNATDVSNSEFFMPSDSLALHNISLTVYAHGLSGDVQGANVNISCTLGYFGTPGTLWVEGTTALNGEADFWWMAPDTFTEVDTLDVNITANITHVLDTNFISQNITVHPIDFSTSAIVNWGDDPIYEQYNSTFEVYANSSIYPHGVAGSIIDLSCDEGYFLDTLTATTQAVADANGYATVDWNANLSIVILSPILVNFTAFISYTGKTVNTTLYTDITVNPIDLDSSTLLLSSHEVSGSEVVDVTTRAVGAYGELFNANVTLIALDGNFSNGETTIVGYTDSNGYFVTTWTAPEVSANLSVLITAEFRYTYKPLLVTREDTVNVTADVHDFDVITLVADQTIVDVGALVELTLTTTNELLQAVEDASITFIAPEGTFVGNGLDTITVQTNSTGGITVIWNTTDANPTIGGFDYNITATLIKEYYNTAESSVIVHVDPIIYQLETDSSSSPSSITKGANVTITVHVTANSLDIEGVTVQILAQSGVFAISSEESASKNSDASGIVIFIWITVGMTVSQARDFTFTIGATLPGYDDSVVEEITVHVEPDSAEPTTPTDGEGLSSFEKLGVLFGIVGGIVLLSLGAYLIFRKKPAYY